MGSTVKKVFDPFGLKKKSAEAAGVSSPDIPAPEPVKPMPIGDDEAVGASRRRSLATQKKRSGRVSTVLSKSETLG